MAEGMWKASRVCAAMGLAKRELFRIKETVLAERSGRADEHFGFFLGGVMVGDLFTAEA